MRIGVGYDSHRFEEGRRLVLGGLEFPGERGLKGHSDADVVIHAVIDALLGAVALGDIGSHFPDTDERWRGADSAKLLESVVREIRETGYAITNVDVTVICERPKLGPRRDEMRARLAELLGVGVSSVSVKGKTNERMDDVGAGVGIAVHAAALLDEIAAPRFLKAKIADCGRYLGRHPRFAAAFEFLRRPDLFELAPGRYEILPDGECWASVETPTLRHAEDAQFEAHGRYIDIQVPFSRAETIVLGTTPQSVLDAAFRDGKDIVFFDTPAERELEMRPGEFAILFPGECAHKPCVVRGTPEPIRKMVIKVLA